MAEDTGTEGQAKEEGGAKEVPDTPKPTIFEEYRTRIDAGEKVFTPKPEEGGSNAKEEPPEGEKAPKEEEGEGEGEGEKAAAEGDGEGEGDGAGEGEKAEGEEAGEGEGGEAEGKEAEGKETGDGETFTVGLPGRNDGDSDIEFEVDTAADRDALNRLRKGYMRGEEARRQQVTVQGDRDEIEEIDTMMATDPAGFLLEKVSKDYRIQVARALLLDDEVHKALEEELAGFEDDTAREHARLKSDAERRDTSDKAKAKLSMTRAAKRAVGVIHGHITDLIPEGTDQGDAVAFQRLALSTAEAACNRLGRLDITKDELVAALKEARVLKLLDGQGKPPSRKKTGKAGTDGSGDAPTKADALKKAKLRRKNVAGSSPAGVGSPPAAVELPKNQSVTERIAHARKVGIGNILRGKGKG